MCKEPECDKAVIQTHRKDSTENWKYLVLVALGTEYGRKARARAVYRVSQLRFEAKQLEDTKVPDGRVITLQVQFSVAAGSRSLESSAYEPSPPSPGWSLVQAAPVRRSWHRSFEGKRRSSKGCGSMKSSPCTPP